MFNVVNVLNFVRKHDRAILTIATTVFAAAAAWFSATETASMSEQDKEDIKLGSATEKVKVVVKTHPKTTFCLLATATAAGAGFKLGASAIASASTAAAVAFKERDRIAREARAFLGDEKYRELMNKVQKAEQSELAKLQLKPSGGNDEKRPTFTDNFLTKKVKAKLELDGHTIWFKTSMSKINWVEHEFNYEFYKNKRVTAEYLLDLFDINDGIGTDRDKIDAINLVWYYDDRDRPYEYIMFTPWFDDTDQCVAIDIETDPVTEVFQLSHKNPNDFYREAGYIV